ncbi:hypothetical protein [Neisseria weaveri]|uniref:hypothetical protein n=1 Tax=Neisseria weaveri TaxID=28091 RepID=UPI000D300E1D|nr:hypothetical protein [Neisseria weaveri]
MKNIIWRFFLPCFLLIIVLKFLYPYLCFWNSNIYLSEFNKTLTVLKKSNGKANQFILDGVVDYKVKNEYLLVLRMVIITNDTSITYTGKYQYWAIKYTTGRKIGPFLQDEFNKFLAQNRLGKNTLSIPDSYHRYPVEP